MKRRQFLNGLTAATVSGVAMVGCQSKSQKNNAAAKATPGSTPDCTGGDPKEVCYKAQMLMIFMLAFSQKDFGTKVLFVEQIFPNTGTFQDFPNHPFVAKLGVDAAALQFFRDQLINGGFNPTDIKKTFNTVNLFFSQLVAYTGSECPSQTSLTNIITTAKAQHQ